MHDHESFPLIPIKSAKGVWPQDFGDNRYLDAISSWWVNLFGHANPDINAALKIQLDTLEQVIFAGFTHETAIDLAKKLVNLTPAGLSRCFYADNGSSAVEVALKMSFHSWQKSGTISINSFQESMGITPFHSRCFSDDSVSSKKSFERTVARRGE